MHSKSFKTKLIAVFLVAFVCLNAGGAMCVAYCQSALEKVSASTEHCPLKKKADHCDPDLTEEAGATANSFGSNEIDCCPMTVSFIGGPIEKRSITFETAAISAVATIRHEAPTLPHKALQILPAAYRGPPMDRRVERVKNCIIRI
jgi:hypothetical protein